MKKLAVYLFFAINFLVIFFLWTLSYNDVLGQGLWMIGFGRLTGLLGQFFIVVQLALIGRIPWIERLFGLDKMNKLHRWVGYGIVTFFLAHVFLTILGYAYFLNLSYFDTLFSYLQIDDYFEAFVGLFLFIVAILLSIPVVRKLMKYETWHITHLFMYAAIVLVLGHQTVSGDVSAGWPSYYWLAFNYGTLALVITYRWARPLYFYLKHRFYLERVVQETSDVYSVYIGGRNMEQFHYEAGQFAYLFFLSKGLWSPHPFSFSKACDGKSLRFSVKMSGDFTNRISQLKPGTKILLDGPLGIFTIAHAKKAKFLLLAGGIGITPLRALIEELSGRGSDAVMLYGSKTVEDIVFKDEIEALSCKTYFILSRAENAPANGSYEMGYVDMDRITRLVPDYKERDIYICGPGPMMKIAKTLMAAGVPREQVHFEKFML